MGRRFWTHIEDKTLRDMVSTDERAEEIASELGRTIHAVYRRIDRLKLVLPCGPRVDPFKRSRILDMISVEGGMSCNQIAKRIGVSEAAIRRILHDYKKRGVVNLIRRGCLSQWVVTQKWTRKDIDAR